MLQIKDINEINKLNRKNPNKKYQQYFVETRYMPAISLKIASEKPSAIKVLDYIVGSANYYGTLVTSEQELAKKIHVEPRTAYSSIKYLLKNEYIAIGSTGGSTNNVFVVNPHLFWFPDAIYNSKRYEDFPSAVVLGRQRNRKFYKRIRNFSKQAQKNIDEDPVFAKRVHIITKAHKNHLLLVKSKENEVPIIQALYSITYLNLKKKAMSVVRYVFSHLELSTLGVYQATNKSIYNGMVKKGIKVSKPTVGRTMAKLTKNNIITRHKNMIMFSAASYKNRREHHVKANNIRHLKIQRKNKELHEAKAIRAKEAKAKLDKINKMDSQKEHLIKIIKEQKNQKM